MRSTFLPALTIVVATVLASPAQAAPSVAVLIRDGGEQDEDGAITIDLRVLNEDSKPQTFSLPDRIEARIECGGEARPIWLERVTLAQAQDNLTIQPDGFERARYRFSAPVGQALDGARISIPAWGARETTLFLTPAVRAHQLAQGGLPPPEHADASKQAAPPVSDRTAGNVFLANLSAYEPIYAVYGPGTDSEARIQFSFKYQLFGSRQFKGRGSSWRTGFHFAYTQRMFWDLGAHSSPFRNIDYQPELFYLAPSATLSSGISLSAQGGVRHESNGRDGAASRSVNSIYVAPMAAIPLGSDYRLSLAPRLSIYVGDLSDNPDIRRYRGSIGLFLEVGKDDGLRLSTSSRFNFGSGKGAINADVSYPLSRLLGSGPDFYLFGQSFFGYGENLLDYNRTMTRVRLGVALIR